MMTNEIQELLEGGLADERMAEVLHTLSVSPEKRAAFRQHMALSTAMQRDRESSGLTAAEDLALWGAISGQGVPAATATQTAPFFGWFARTVTLVAVGVGCYLLGSNSSTNIFRSGDTVQPTVAQRSPAPTSVSAPTVSPAVTADRGASATDQAVPQSSRMAVQPKASSSKSSSVVALQKNNDVVTSFGSTESRGGEQGGLKNAPPVTPDEPLRAPSLDPVQFSAAQPPAILQKESLRQPNGGSFRSIQADTSETKLNNRHGDVEVPVVEAPTVIAALRTGSFEFGFGEHVGWITTAPEAMISSDPNFSNRSFDVSYHHPVMGGQIGVGARATYGTFSTVNLYVAPTRNDAGILNIEGKLEAKTGLLGELFVNYRYPIANRLALGVEGSAGGTSRTDYRFGGDLFLLWFVTDRLGMQAGAGVGNYAYDRTEQRAKLMREHTNVGPSDKVLDSYRGNFAQGRYGLLYRF
jgi:hypothetical protein